jgi:hypothetical protein
MPPADASWLDRLAAFNPAGGIRYHLLARRHARKLWEPFRWALGEWLLRWTPPETTLLVVGPSAGYNLQPFLFERFERVVVLEPDPIARFLFRRRLRRAPLERQPRLDFIADDHLVQHPERLVPLLERLGQPALLFGNVLGQVAILLDGLEPGAGLDAVRGAVRAATVGRSFASVHDRVSGPLPPSFDGLRESSRRWTDEEVLAHAYATDGAAPLVELEDHFTEGFFPPELPHAYLRWEVSPGQHHLIEAVASTRGPSARPSG